MEELEKHVNEKCRSSGTNKSRVKEIWMGESSVLSALIL